MFQHAPCKTIGKRGIPRKATYFFCFFVFLWKCGNRSRQSMCDSLCDRRFFRAIGELRKCFLSRHVCVIACVIPLSLKSWPVKHQSVSQGLSHKFWSTVLNIIIPRKQAQLCDTPSPWQPLVFISGTPKLCVPRSEKLV